MMNRFQFSILVAIAIFLTSCDSNENASPRPRGYFRIDLPQKSYKRFDTTSAFVFEYPTYSRIDLKPDNHSNMLWYNIEFPTLNATLHLSYKTIDGDITKLLEDSYTLVYKHTVKAEAIDEKLVIDDKKHKFGIIYDIKGDAASAFQFVLTDSVKHFVRGALYFNVIPNKDSIAPVLTFVKEDVMHLIETFEWKK